MCHFLSNREWTEFYSIDVCVSEVDILDDDEISNYQLSATDPGMDIMEGLRISSNDINSMSADHSPTCQAI